MGKTKHGIFLDDKNFKKASDHYQEYNFRSVSELIDQALEFYLAYRAAGEAEIYLNEALTQTLRSTVQQTENRLAKILYKIAVEDAMIKQLLAVAARITPEQAEKLRKSCIDEIKTLNGMLDLKQAAKRQADAEEWE